jgi:hypothetical protein
MMHAYAHAMQCNYGAKHLRCYRRHGSELRQGRRWLRPDLEEEAQTLMNPSLMQSCKRHEWRRSRGAHRRRPGDNEGGGRPVRLFAWRWNREDVGGGERESRGAEEGLEDHGCRETEGARGVTGRIPDLSHPSTEVDYFLGPVWRGSHYTSQIR